MSDRDNANPTDGGIKVALRVRKDGNAVEKYHLVQVLGEGSFGLVYRAMKGETEVALKILKGSMTSDDAKRELKSLEALKDLHHPNLLATYNFWSDDDQLYIEMEMADGGSLKDRLLRCQDAGGRGIPVDELLKYFGEMAQALDYLHGRRPSRFLHRDIKPANVLLVGGCAKLADFGLLRQIAGDRSGTKTQGGTPVYMAPESIKSDVFSIRTDLFSLAITYAELRQGKLPFSGQTPYQVCHNILHAAPELDDFFHPDEKAVLLKALEKDPDRRQASCGEFVAQLRRAVPVGHGTPQPTTPVAVENAAEPDTSTPDSTFVPGHDLHRSPNTQMAPIPAQQTVSPDKASKLIWLAPIVVLMVVTVGTAVWFFTNRGPKVIPPPVRAARNLEIKTTPSGATVYIDDKKQSDKTNGTFEVPDAASTLRLSLPGYKEVRQSIVPGQDKVDVAMERIPLPPVARTIEIKTTPPGATVFIDGKLQNKKTNGTFEVPDVPYQLRLVATDYKEVRQTIDPGQTKIDIAMVKVEAIPGVAYALLVGVNQPTPHLPDFIHAESDVRQLGNVLVAGGYQTKNVQVLTQNLEGVPPTANRIREALKALTKTCTSADTMVIGLAGHIVAFEGQRESYFCPAGSDLADKSTLLPVAEIFEHLQTCKALNKLVLLDGWRTDLFTPPALPNGITIARERGKNLKPPPGVVLLTGCSPGERGNQHASNRHGLFFHALVRGLQGAAEVGTDRHITFDALANYAVRQIIDDAQREFKLRQTPEFLGDDGSRKRLLFAHADVLSQVNEGIVALEKKNDARALSAFNEAEVKDPSYLDLYLGRAQAYSSKGKDDPGNYDKALQDCQEALKLDPRNATAVGTLAQIEALKARQLPTLQKRAELFQSALDHHDRAILLDPQWAMAYNHRGVTQAMRREYRLAIKDYTEAIRLDASLKFPYENRGFAYTTQKEYENAVKDFDKAIQIDSTNPLTFARRGSAYRILGKLDHAIKDLNKAVELDSNNANSLYSRGLAHVAKKEFDSAIKDFTDALTLQADKETLCSRGYAYNEKGVKEKNTDLYDRAIKDLTDAIKLSPKYVPAFYFRGVAYQNKAKQNKNDAKLFDLAIKDFDLVIELTPLHANALYSRGQAYLSMGQKAKGEADIKKAREIDRNVGQEPGVPDGVRLDRGTFHLALGMTLAVAEVPYQ